MAGFRKKVLWVDDEIELLRAHIMFLETHGYSVVPVFSGDDAIELIRDKPAEYDIVLLDEQMPGKDGLSTLREIKQCRPDLPVVMVTKSEEERLMEQALGKKIDGYLTKPVNPSQILLVCKRLLNSKQYITSEIKQQFFRNYSENTTALRGRLETLQWMQVYENFARWDTELDTVEDEGLRQAHAGQKSDGNAAFNAFIVENYGHWIKGENKPPVLSPDVLGTFIDPLLREGEQLYLIIISGMRLDQYLSIEETMRTGFAVRRHYYYSILPTDSRFARASLLSGLFPIEIARRYPDESWPLGSETADAAGRFEERLLRDHLAEANLKCSGTCVYTRMTEADAFQERIATNRKNQLTVIVADFVNLLTKGGAPSPIAREIAADERALRSITRAWFENSVLRELLKTLSRKKCTVVLTSDHGIIYCTRGTEVYGASRLEHGVRYKFGKGINTDERRAVALDDPRHFKLPLLKNAPSFIIAKENFYFTPPERFKNTHLESHNSFQRGGISMEEMIMPLAVFSPL